MVKIKPLKMPPEIEVKEHNQRYGRFILSPLERGFGNTIGHSLRRTLLSSVQGTAITSIRIDGVLHEFSTIPKVVEDVPEIILNLKKVKFTPLAEEMQEQIYLKAKGPKEVKAGDIDTGHIFEVANKDQHIASIESGGKIDMEMTVDTGRGYIPQEMLKIKKAPIGTIFLDASFSPVTRVKYRVENTRVGGKTDYDKLIMEIWTDGTVTPEEAISIAAKILKDYMDTVIIHKVLSQIVEEEMDEETKKLKELVNTSVGEFEFSVRASHVMKDTGITTLGELVSRTEQEMLKLKNFGRKSLSEMKKVLETLNLSFGMDVSKYMEVEKDETQEKD